MAGSSFLRRLLEFRTPPTEDDSLMLRQLGIETPKDLPDGPPVERDPAFVPEGNRRKPEDPSFLRLNWCTGIVLVAFLLLTLLGTAMAVSYFEIRHGDPRKLSASVYFPPPAADRPARR
jgi:hypothetical protein